MRSSDLTSYRFPLDDLQHLEGMMDPQGAPPSPPRVNAKRSLPPPPSADTLPSLLPSSSSTTPSSTSTVSSKPKRRADLITLKQRLAQLLSKETGGTYWQGLTDYLLGKINRYELGQVFERSFNHHTSYQDRLQAINLHNALLLSILYNTTKTTLPSSSIRHVGFNPRGTKKRNLLAIIGPSGGGTGGGYDAGLESGDEENNELQEERRKKLKETVMRLGKRERREIKNNANALNLVGGKESLGGGGAGRGENVGQSERSSRGGNGQVVEGGVPKSYKDGLDQKGTGMPTNFTQEYNRLIQAPLCCESRALPDSDTLRDRTMLISYEEGMIDGVEGSGVSNLMSNALDHYVKQIIASAVSLVRGSSSSSELDPSPSDPNPPPSTSTFAPALSSPLPNSISTPSSPPAPRSRPTKRPLAISDFHALFAIQPALLGPNGSTHTSAVERMYALPPQSDSEDSGTEPEPESFPNVVEKNSRDVLMKDSSSTSEEVVTTLEDVLPLRPISSLSGKIPRLSTTLSYSRNRGLSFYGSSRPLTLPSSPTKSPASNSNTPATAAVVTGTEGGGVRTKFLLDPTSLHGVPEGHPDVPHVISSSSSSTTIPSSILPPLVPSSSANDLQSGGGGTSTPVTGTGTGENGQQLSPKSLSLRNSLFPELAAGAAAAGNSTPTSSSTHGIANSSTTKGATTTRAAQQANTEHSKGGDGGEDHELGGGPFKSGNGTTTDEADSEFDDLAEEVLGQVKSSSSSAKGGRKLSMVGGTSNLKKSGSLTNNGTPAAGGGGLKIKLGGQTTGTVTPTGVATPGGTGAGPNQSGAPKSASEKDKEMGRKLWEVVDSVRLLDGVLDP